MRLTKIFPAEIPNIIHLNSEDPKSLIYKNKTNPSKLLHAPEFSLGHEFVAVTDAHALDAEQGIVVQTRYAKGGRLWPCPARNANVSEACPQY